MLDDYKFLLQCLLVQTLALMSTLQLFDRMLHSLCCIGGPTKVADARNKQGHAQVISVYDALYPREETQLVVISLYTALFRTPETQSCKVDKVSDVNSQCNPMYVETCNPFAQFNSFANYGSN